MPLETGVGGPDEDPAAIFVTDHLVGRGGADLVQFNGRQHLPAAAALAAAQLRRPVASGGGADLVVEGEEVCGHVGDHGGAGGSGKGDVPR